MSLIAESMTGTPMVLKGGTGLLLCYGLDRFSEDLDFDCPKKISLENRIKSALLLRVARPHLKLLKDGENVTRYRFTGTTTQGELSIKIETSHRDAISPDDITLINGIQVYKLPVLAGMKLKATEGRTAPRDLYDIHFIARSKMEAFQGDDLQKLREFTSDTNGLLARHLEKNTHSRRTRPTAAGMEVVGSVAPEPSIYTMFIAGLTVLGLISRRKLA